MAIPSVPRPYLLVAASVLFCTIVFFWTPIQPAAVSHYRNYASGVKSGNLNDIRNETLGVRLHSSLSVVEGIDK
jgi:hypothetical protein